MVAFDKVERLRQLVGMIDGASHKIPHDAGARVRHRLIHDRRTFAHLHWSSQMERYCIRTLNDTITYTSMLKSGCSTCEWRRRTETAGSASVGMAN